MLDSNQHRRFWRPPCYQLHQCHIPDLVNVQVGRTFGMVEWALPPTARNVYVYMHPSGRASPSVINRLIKAGSLLSLTCSSGDIRAMPSVSQAATPMKPRANLGNRTRRPKGRANRIASQPQKTNGAAIQAAPGGTGTRNEDGRNLTDNPKTHTIFRDSSTLKGLPAGFEPASRHAWSREPENHARLTLPQER